MSADFPSSSSPVVVITGAGGGIGRALVSHFLQARCRVVGLDILNMEGQEGSRREEALFFRCDVTSEEDVARAIGEAAKEFGRIDCLINNAAIASPYLSYDRFEDIDLVHFQKYININLFGPVLMMKYCVPFLRTTGGSIINISSTRARMSEPKCEGKPISHSSSFSHLRSCSLPFSPLPTGYAASKGGIESLTHATALSLSADGIRVNAIAPGWINVAAYTPSPTDNAFHPTGRVGVAADVCHACEFLMSREKSGFITGQTIVIDGGVTRKMIYPVDEAVKEAWKYQK